MDDEHGTHAKAAEVQRIAAKQQRMKTYVFVVMDNDHMMSVHMCVDEAMQAGNAWQSVQVMQVR